MGYDLTFHVGTVRNFSGSPMPSGGELDGLLQWLFGSLLRAGATCFTRLQHLQRVLGLTVPSVLRSRLSNPDGGFEYGAEREYASQFMCSK